MKYPSIILLASLLLLCAGGSSTGIAQLPSTVAQPSPGVLVLRSGEAFQGDVRLSDDEYRLTLPKGELRFRKYDVEYCCGTLQEVYQRKQRAVASDDLQEHLRLAQWCMKQNLFAEASLELDAVAAIDPRQPMLDLFRQRLELLRRPPVAHKSTAPASMPLNSDELDRMIRGLPEGTVEGFTQRVQPLLMNHCATAGCHGPSSTTKFQLLRATSTKTANRRATQRNLLATLQLINRQEPAASLLLVVPSRAHGTAQAAVFSDRQSLQYRRLAEWVFQTAQPAARRVPGDFNPSGLTGQMPPPTPSEGRLTSGSEPLPGAITLEGSVESPAGRSLHRTKPGVRHPGTTPAARDANRPSPQDPAPPDPFDPKVFNERFSTPAR
jgi:hypothetical protein